MCLRHCCDAGELHILPKQSYCVCRWEEDAEVIFDPPLHLPPDEGGPIWVAVRGVCPLGDGGLQRLGQPHGSRVSWDTLLHMGPEKSRGWGPHPLGQAFQCLSLLTSQERQKGGCVEDLPDGGIRCSLQVIYQWVDGRGVPVPSWRKADPLQSPGRTLHCLDWVQEEVRVPEPVGTGKEEAESVWPGLGG